MALRPLHGPAERFTIAMANHVSRMQARSLARIADRTPGWLWVPVVALLAAVYLTAQISLRDLLPGEKSVLIVQPALWTLVACISFVLWRYGLPSRPRPDLGILTQSLSLGIFQIGAWLLAGLAFGFGLSPHGQEIPVVLGNLLFAGTALIGMEMARACIVVSLAERSPSLALAVSAGALTLVSIPVGRFGFPLDVPNGLRFAGETLFPGLAQNLLASVLALGAGPLAPLVYRGLIAAFEWFFPILPDLGWMVTAFVGTMPAALGLLMVEGHFSRGADALRRDETRSPLPVSWLLAAAALATLVYFNAGGFGVRPMLIVGPSMRPTFETGDIVITTPISSEAVHVDDVIRFRTGDETIVHRVKEIQRDEAGLIFITRGDGNNVDDPPVLPEQIEGKMILLVPKIGWIALGFRKFVELLV